MTGASTNVFVLTFKVLHRLLPLYLSEIILERPSRKMLPTLPGTLASELHGMAFLPKYVKLNYLTFSDRN